MRINKCVDSGTISTIWVVQVVEPKLCVRVVNANHDGDNGDYDDDDYNILISVQGKGAKPEC